jgi:hypothetical protein
MEMPEFVKLVFDMRLVQKRFFDGDRTAAVVGEAKKLERRVDAAIQEFRRPPGLFDKITGD